MKHIHQQKKYYITTRARNKQMKGTATNLKTQHDISHIDISNLKMTQNLKMISSNVHIYIFNLSQDHTQRQPLQNFDHSGLARQVATRTSFSTWVITPLGCGACTFARPLAFAGWPLQGDTTKALEDQSVYELAMGLRREGWELEVLPKGGHAAHLPSFRPLAEQPRKVWYARRSDKNFHRDYLLCLRAPQDFWARHGVEEIKHLQKLPYYTFLWEGHPQRALRALEDGPRRQSAGEIADGDADDTDAASDGSHGPSDVEPDKPMAALEDEVPPAEDLTAFEGEAETLARAAGPEDLTALGGNGVIRGSGSGDADDAASDQSSSSSTRTSSSSTSSSTSAQAPSTSADPARQRHEVFRQHGREQNGRWVDSAGQSFRWSYTPRDPSPRGTYTLTCPYHKDRKKACTRTRSWKTCEEREMIICQLMQWCCAATYQGVGSKNLHMDLPINAETMQEPPEIIDEARERGFDVDGATEGIWCPMDVAWDGEEEPCLPKVAI